MTRIMPTEWLEVEGTDRDGDEVAWKIDLGFMLSTYQCTFGNGCPGAWGEETHPGCCATGPYLSTDDDIEALQACVDQLKPEHTANYTEIKKRWHIERTESPQVRKVDGMCIFYNQGTSEDGSIGCSLHAEAMRQDKDWRDWKPEICWSVPLRVDETEGTIGPWDRDNNGGWGKDGDGDEGWWCIEEQSNYPSAEATPHDISTRVFVTLANELNRVLGWKAYKMLFDYCRQRVSTQDAAEVAKASTPVSISKKRST